MFNYLNENKMTEQARTEGKTYSPFALVLIYFAVMSPPEFIPVSTPVDDLLGALSQKRTHLAYIKSDNKVLGIITVEDILEELVGEIYDEEDAIGGDRAV